jgi:ankyrin repeat protein
MNSKVIQTVLDGGADLKHLLRQSPEIVCTRMKRDQLIKSIPHWLYIGDSALHLAAAALNINAVKLLIKAGADPNAENRRRATPLHYACDARPALSSVWNPKRQAAIIQLLLRHDARLEHADRGGATALHRAVRARSSEAVRHLLIAGARVNSRLGNQQSTPLHLAVHSTGAGGTAGAIDEQVKIIRLLLQYGANPATPDATGKSAYEAAGNRIREAFAAS